MSYSLHPAEPLRDGVARIARQQFEEARGLLRDQPEGINHAIHYSRKAFKRVRSLYRLVRAGDKSFQKRENVRIRDMARSLSAARDAAALVETIDRLLADHPAEQEQAILARIRRRLEDRRDGIIRHEADLPRRIEAAIATCRAAIDALDDLTLDATASASARIVGKGWERTCAGAHSAMRLCAANHDDPRTEAERADAFHDLRKRAQDHWLQTRLLRELWPSVMHERRDETKRLVDLLGQACDLSILLELKDRAPREVGKPADLACLMPIVVPRMETFRARSLARAAALLPEEPAFSGGRIRILWRHDARKA